MPRPPRKLAVVFVRVPTMRSRRSALMLGCCCFIVAAAFAIPPRQWSRPTGVGSDACVATNGDVFLAGSVDGTVDFGDTSVTSAGSRDIMVSRYDPVGNTVWVRTAGKSGAFTSSNGAHGVVPSTDGGCIVAGTLTQELTFDSAHVVADTSGNVFVARYDAGGTVLWATSFGAPNSHTVAGAAPDNDGGCYTLSYYFGDQSAHAVLTRHDDAGTLQWQIDGSDGFAHAIGADPDGNAVITGHYTPPFTFGDSTLSTGGNGKFLAKVSPAGDVLWMRRYATGSVDANDVVVDPTGTIYVCGKFFGSPAIGDTTLSTNSFYFDGFLARHDAGGNFQWAREIDAAGIIDEAELRNIAITPTGSCVASARFFRSVIVDGDTLLGSEGHDGGLLVEWASDGTLINYLSTGSGQGAASLPRPIAVNGNGVLYHYSIDDTLTGPNLVGYASTVSSVHPSVPTGRATLISSYPNPFNPTTTISFRVVQPSSVELIIFDAAGRRVRTLATGAYYAGVHRLSWDGTGDRGPPVATGVYFVQLRAGRHIDSRKLVLIK